LNVDSSALVLSRVKKSFGGVEALRGASLTCEQGEIHALIGENGAGKSTLIKVLAGAVRADEGDVSLDGETLALRSPLDARRAGIATVFQELSLIPDLSVAANLFYSDEPRVRAGRIDKRALRHKAAATLHELGVQGIDVSSPIRELSLTQRQVLEISKAVIRKPAVLVLDEPTSALLPEQVGWLFAKVREFAEAGGIAVFISHRLEEIENLCHRATVFRGGIDVGSGAIEEMPEARLVELMLGRQVDRVYPERDDAPDTGKQAVLEVTGLSSPPKIHDISLTIGRGEIAGIGGLQGQGQHELFLALFGAYRSSGRVVMNGREVRLRKPEDALGAGIVLIPEDRATEGLCLTLAIRDNISLGSLKRVSAWGVLRPQKERRLVGDMVARLQIVLRSTQQDVGSLSGGNQQKVLLGRVLAQQPLLLLMYDATRGVDVGTKTEIYRLMRELCAQGISILFYSSDVSELSNLADRVLVLHDGAIRATLAGDELTDARIVAAAVGGLREAGE
jgi:ribose transport system ATP-binding protein